MKRALFLFAALVISASGTSAFELEHHQTPDLRDAIPSDSRLTLINFWATWCVPCVAELEDLAELDSEFANSDLMILGVSLDSVLPIELSEARKRAEKMLAEKNIEYPNVLYTGSQKDLAVEWEMDSGIPFSVLVDTRSGAVLRSYTGRIEPSSLRKEIRELLTR